MSVHREQIGPHEYIITHFDVRGNKLCQYQTLKGCKHGFYVSWHQNGQTAIKCHYRRGKPVGDYIEWLPNGQKLQTIFY